MLCGDSALVYRGVSDQSAHIVLKVFHDVQEAAIRAWFVLKLGFDSVEISNCLRDIDSWAIETAWCARRHRSES